MGQRSSSSSPGGAAKEPYDATFVHSLREARFILILWGLCFLWTVPFCYVTGYVPADEPFDPAQLKTVFGIPQWTFFGILVPWLLADVATTWFCFRYMVPDDLGEANEGADIEEEIDEMHAGEDGP